jgi:hypothetical protein
MHPASQKHPKLGRVERLKKKPGSTSSSIIHPTPNPQELVSPDLQRLVRRPTRSKRVQTVQEFQRVDRFEHHRHRPSKSLVFEGRHGDWASGRAIALRTVRTPHGRSSVTARLGAFEQVP